MFFPRSNSFNSVHQINKRVKRDFFSDLLVRIWCKARRCGSVVSSFYKDGLLFWIHSMSKSTKCANSNFSLGTWNSKSQNRPCRKVSIRGSICLLTENSPNYSKFGIAWVLSTPVTTEMSFAPRKVDSCLETNLTPRINFFSKCLQTLENIYLICFLARCIAWNKVKDGELEKNVFIQAHECSSSQSHFIMVHPSNLLSFPWSQPRTAPKY